MTESDIARGLELEAKNTALGDKPDATTCDMDELWWPEARITLAKYLLEHAKELLLAAERERALIAVCRNLLAGIDNITDCIDHVDCTPDCGRAYYAARDAARAVVKAYDTQHPPRH